MFTPCNVCSVPWGVQYRGDIMMHVGDIMSTVGVFSTVGRGGGRIFLLFVYPHGTEHSHGTHDIPHIYHDITVIKISPYGTEHLPRYS